MLPLSLPRHVTHVDGHRVSWQNAALSVPLESSKIKTPGYSIHYNWTRKSKQRIYQTLVETMIEDLDSSPVLETSDLDFSYPDIGTVCLNNYATIQEFTYL